MDQACVSARPCSTMTVCAWFCHIAIALPTSPAPYAHPCLWQTPHLLLRSSGIQTLDAITGCMSSPGKGSAGQSGNITVLLVCSVLSSKFSVTNQP